MAVHEGFADHHACRLRFAGDRIDIRDRRRQRLLAEHVLAGPHRPDRPCGMERVRQRVVDRIDLRIVDERLVTGVNARDPPLARVDLGPRMIPARHRHELVARRGAHGGMMERLMRAVPSTPQRNGFCAMGRFRCQSVEGRAGEACRRASAIAVSPGTVEMKAYTNGPSCQHAIVCVVFRKIRSVTP